MQIIKFSIHVHYEKKILFRDSTICRFFSLSQPFKCLRNWCSWFSCFIDCKGATPELQKHKENEWCSLDSSLVTQAKEKKMETLPPLGRWCLRAACILKPWKEWFVSIHTRHHWPELLATRQDAEQPHCNDSASPCREASCRVPGGAQQEPLLLMHFCRLCEAAASRFAPLPGWR